MINKRNIGRNDRFQQPCFNGNFTRAKHILKEKHLPLKYTDEKDDSRIKQAIQDREGVSLRESFNMNMYKYHQFKPIEKKKWRSPLGMSYQGQFGAHVV